jgi:hypothetical protein
VTEQMVKRARRGMTPGQHAVLRALVDPTQWPHAHALVSTKRMERCLQGLERRRLARELGVTSSARHWAATELGVEVAGRPAPQAREQMGTRA